MNNVACPGPSFREKIKVDTTPVAVDKPLSVVGSTPMDVSQAFRYTFFATIISGPEVNVFVQVSPDLQNWFLDSPVTSINLPPSFVTDKAVLTANNYSSYARLGFVQTKYPCEITVVFQSQLLPCILPSSQKGTVNREINTQTAQQQPQALSEPQERKAPLNWRL